MDVKTTIEGMDEIGASIDAWAPQILNELAAAAVNHLKELEMQPDVAGAPHPALAALWTHGEPNLQGDGWHAEVFSKAEDIAFHEKTDEQGNKLGKHVIMGTELLAILEGGAKAHFIRPVTAKALAFVSPGAALAGAMFERRYGFAYGPANNPAAMVFAKLVDHPGVVANRHVQQTADYLNQVVGAMGQEAADRIAATVK